MTQFIQHPPFGALETAQLIHHEGDVSQILVQNSHCLYIKYGKTSVNIKSSYLIIHASEYGGDAEHFETKTTLLAQLPAPKNAWHGDPVARLPQLASLIQKHQLRSQRFRALMALAIGTIGSQNKNFSIVRERKTLRIFGREKNFPYQKEFYDIAQNVFVVRNGRFDRILNAEFFIKSKTPTAHEALELEQKIHCFAQEPEPRP